MSWMPLMIFSVLALTGCSKTPAVPDTVREMMETDIPADGRIHVQSRGKVTIQQKTPTCFFPHGFIVDPTTFVRALGQSKTLDIGAGRLQSVNDQQCSVQPDTVFMQGAKLSNRNRDPYKLVLAVWQGDPMHGGGAWVGSVERLNGPRPDANSDNIDVRDFPNFWGPSSSDLVQKALIESSIELDISEMSNSFAKAVKSR